MILYSWKWAEYQMKNRIYVSKGVYFLILLSAFQGRRNIYLLSILFAFVHECSHLLMAVIIGEKPKKISLLANGFELTLQGVKNRKKLIIYLAGPIISILLCYFFYKINKISLSKINFLIFTINILPALPLDGGRIFYCITQNKIKLKNLSRLVEIILYSLSFFEKGYLWFLPVVFIIHKSIKKMPYDIFVNDLIKRLEKEDKI